VAAAASPNITAARWPDDERGDGVTGKLAAAGVLAAFEKQPEKRMFNPCGAEFRVE
jgi:hypothetical protein